MSKKHVYLDKVPHGGKLIKGLLKKHGISAKKAAKQLDLAPSNLYSVYLKRDLHMAEVLMWSDFLKEDLWQHYTNPLAKPLVAAELLEAANRKLADLEKEAEKLRIENDLLKRIVMVSKG